ncbi:uncharacterized protein LOC127291378 [Leptopilina boulardi]|uniref:uncharacterized protein LOC127291378 n=1 Tax=Leptopilina boulardi TaxID=63433 RepID=UPI0021F5A980|nr:uncharacterized protein LOC127291378 [Leptopilina boulardi]XP_051176425.1 uncharacterized protein LOC127291378 [Leptopilina boulardi]XP_051176426.1 uncharacterized protein LOC127291378 [Leptopilina boulardi]
MLIRKLTFLALLLVNNEIKCEIDYDFAETTAMNYRNADENTELYIDNRIDEVPTYVPPAEKLIKHLMTGLGIITGRSSDTIRRSGMDKILSEITRPITSIFNRNTKSGERSMRSTGFGDILNLITDHFQAIYPGTLWCGAGHLATNSEEVGFFKVTDACCRSHDNCSYSLQAGRSNKGLRNDGVFTRSHCTCDEEFHECLKNAHSVIATKIGITYFNILRPQCFKMEYPATCRKYGHLRLARSKCKEYEIDTTKNIAMQWFDNPDF